MERVDIEVSEEVANAVSDLAVRHYGDSSIVSQQHVVETAVRWALGRESTKITFDMKPEVWPLYNGRWKRLWDTILSEETGNRQSSTITDIEKRLLGGGKK